MAPEDECDVEGCQTCSLPADSYQRWYINYTAGNLEAWDVKWDPEIRF